MSITSNNISLIPFPDRTSIDLYLVAPDFFCPFLNLSTKDVFRIFPPQLLRRDGVRYQLTLIQRTSWSPVTSQQLSFIRHLKITQDLKTVSAAKPLFSIPHSSLRLARPASFDLGVQRYLTYSLFANFISDFFSATLSPSNINFLLKRAPKVIAHP